MDKSTHDGEWFRLAIRGMGLTVQEASERLGKSRPTVNNWYKEKTFDYEMKLLILNKLGIDIDNKDNTPGEENRNTNEITTLLKQRIHDLETLVSVLRQKSEVESELLQIIKDYRQPIKDLRHEIKGPTKNTK